MIRRRPTAHRRRGFTLIDIMIALVIIAILTSLAYPSYLNQVRKSKRTVAKSALLDAADRQEQFFFTHRGYADAMNKLAGYGDIAGNTVLFREDGSPATDQDEAIYAVSVEAVDKVDACGAVPCFLLQAVPRNDQVNDGCGTFKLSSSNHKEPDPNTSACW